MASEQLAEVLTEFARTMVTDFRIQEILDRLVTRIVDIMPVTAAGVTLISADLEPHYVAASDESALRYEKLQSKLEQGPCLATFGSGEAIAIPDLAADDRFPEFGPRAAASGLMAVFTFPLNHADTRLGALDLYRDSPGEISAESMRVAQTLADVAAAYLINAQARADLQASTDRSREVALHDALTGLPNRVLMLERLEHALLCGRRSKDTTAVFFLDLDEFKAVNDAYGHKVGDELLIAVGERLTHILRPGDSLGRFSGDEFVVVCEGLPGPAEAAEIAARFDASFAEPFSLSGTELQIDASVGIAFSGQDADTPDALIHDADLAMYRTKRTRNRDHAVIHLRELHLAERGSGLARGLPGALQRDEFHLEYQPIVRTRDEQLIGAEALLRWTRPGRGPIEPRAFMPFAEQSGQIIELGRWVLEQACSEAHHWQTFGSDPIALSVNVSPHQFMSADFAGTVAHTLAAAALDPRVLTLEVTENVFLHDGERALTVLSDLKNIGVKLALDDFGTGYSSLGYLEKLPVDSIKIDQTFIAKLPADPRPQAIVTHIIELAHSLGLTVVAEGVETAAQHQALVKLGADACQGFYFAKPTLATGLDRLATLPGNGSGLFPRC